MLKGENKEQKHEGIMDDNTFQNIHTPKTTQFAMILRSSRK